MVPFSTAILAPNADTNFGTDGGRPLGVCISDDELLFSLIMWVRSVLASPSFVSSRNDRTPLSIRRAGRGERPSRLLLDASRQVQLGRDSENGS
ncbi:hypothetical protein EVAR_49658_1 [Eumeta japonica]|uniref:Uncharacterized protein n=1 Tax=Eumeta variegata TaxID=151549 RepID=A0A4C1Y9Q6_EUMVA|nr:hypothetical protein EVAR_49658_1 [Eumeta japonica]